MPIRPISIHSDWLVKVYQVSSPSENKGEIINWSIGLISNELVSVATGHHKIIKKQLLN